MSVFFRDRRFAPVFARACSSLTPLGLFALLFAGTAQPGLGKRRRLLPSDPSSIGPVVVTSPNRKPVKRAGAETARTRVHARTPGRTRATTTTAPAAGPSNATNEPPRTPLNSNVVATSASRLGLTAFEMPASVEIVDQRTMQEQGYRTTTETAQGAVGVLAGDSGGAFGSFSMRGFTTSAINILYNGIWIGPSDITSRIMDTSNLDRVEFLKGPSSIMSGLDAIGGSVNYVTRQPTSGPIKNEFDASFDSLGHLPHPLRIRRQHDDQWAGLSRRHRSVQNQQLYRRRLHQPHQLLDAVQLPRHRLLQGVRRDRV